MYCYRTTTPNDNKDNNTNNNMLDTINHHRIISGLLTSLSLHLFCLRDSLCDTRNGEQLQNQSDSGHQSPEVESAWTSVSHLKQRSDVMIIILFIYSFIYLFSYLFIYLFTHSFIHYSSIYLFIYVLIYWFIDLLFYSFNHLFMYSLIYSFMYSFIYLFIQSFIHSSINLCIHLFTSLPESKRTN